MKIRLIEAELFHAVGRTEKQTDGQNEPEQLNSFSPISPADTTNICIVFWSSQLCLAVQNRRTM